jgi:hypothetical protein
VPPGVLLCIPGLGDVGDLPLSSEWTCTSGVVIVSRSNGEGKGL